MAKKDTDSNSKGKMSAGKIVMIVFVCILAFVIVAFAGAMALIHHYINLIPEAGDDYSEEIIPPDNQDFETDFSDDPVAPTTTDPNATGTPDETGAPVETTDPDIVPETTAPIVDPGDVNWDDDLPLIGDDHLLNIMIIGQDRRAGEKRQRSDSMMLVSINPDTKKVSLISFLRDTYVQIPGGYDDNRLNTAYKFGGFKLMRETMKHNFDVTIDGCFEVDFFDFMEIIDLLGGVEINVTEKESRHLASFFHVEVPSGTTTLNGEQALAYARIRKIDSDFSRTKRQRTILMTLFNKFKSASIFELNDIANQILPKLKRDMSNDDVIALMTKLIPMMNSMDITQYSVPFEGAYKGATIRKMSVLIPDLAKIRQKLADEYLPK